MATIINGNPIPTISQDYYGTSSSYFKKEKEEFHSRAERIAEAKKRFAKVYEREEGKLPEISEGIVSILFAPYLDMKIIISPDLAAWGVEKPLSIPSRAVRTPYMFESHSFLLKKNKLEELINGNEVLDLDLSQQAAEKTAKYFSLPTPEYQGVKLTLCKGKQHPFRVWKAGREYILISLVNGMVFKLAKKDMPEMSEPERIIPYGDITLKEDRVHPGTYMRY